MPSKSNIAFILGNFRSSKHLYPAAATGGNKWATNDTAGGTFLAFDVFNLGQVGLYVIPTSRKPAYYSTARVLAPVAINVQHEHNNRCIRHTQSLIGSK